MFNNFEQVFLNWLGDVVDPDPAHSPSHVRRVVKMAKQICIAENAKMEIVLPSAYLHDCVVVPKDSLDRSKASTLAGEKAIQLLHEWGYDKSNF